MTLTELKYIVTLASEKHFGKAAEKCFAQFGFKNGDIVTGINGIVLDDPAQALEVYKIMRSAQQASFTVDRNGNPVEIVVSLGAQ